MTIADLVTHLRSWLRSPKPNGFYARFLDHALLLTDEQIADIVRFARTTRGAEMALIRSVRIGEPS
jgi:hypothetical protein